MIANHFQPFTSHRLLRLCKLLWTACSSMLSVRRISCRSLYMFGFASRPNSAEKWDSNSSGDNWMPQIGHELWPVADATPMCIGFFGPIPGWTTQKKIITHQLIFLLPLLRFLTERIIIFSSIFQPLNIWNFGIRCREQKKSCEPINAFLNWSNREMLYCGCVMKYLNGKKSLCANV